jgi:hypothetical protein
MKQLDQHHHASHNHHHNDTITMPMPSTLENDNLMFDLENRVEPIPVAIPISSVEQEEGTQRRDERMQQHQLLRDVILGHCCCRSHNDVVVARSTTSRQMLSNQRTFQCFNTNSILYSFLFSNLFRDKDCQCMGQFVLFDSIEAIRIFKFIFITIWLTISLHGVVRIAGWGHDELYSIQDFMVYDLAGVVLDSFVFAIVSRLYKRNGVDCLLPFFLPMVVSAIYVSWSSEIWFLKSSITLYDMKCTWSWQLYLYAAVCCTLIVTVLILHVVFSIRDKSCVRQLFEMTIIAMVFIVPGATANHESFHLHHYYSFWMLGMLFSREEWWSQVSMAIAWGQYVNGIAVWGRDSVLTCEFASYVAAGNRCGISSSAVLSLLSLSSSDVQMSKIHNITNTTLQDIDWKGCSH